MKKIFALLLISAISLTGCGGGVSFNIGEETKQCEELLGYLSEDDFDGLKSMFCSSTKSSKDFDEQLQQAMDFFEGKVVSYDRPMLGSGKTVESGKVTMYRASSYIENIRTDNNTYDVWFYSYLTNTNNSKIGISEINIKCSDGRECVIGEMIK